jgi:hypothetical protein
MCCVCHCCDEQHGRAGPQGPAAHRAHICELLQILYLDLAASALAPVKLCSHVNSRNHVIVVRALGAAALVPAAELQPLWHTATVYIAVVNMVYKESHKITSSRRFTQVLLASVL